MLARVRLVAGAGAGVKASGAPLLARASYEELLAAGAGFFVDERDRSLVVMAEDGPGQTIEMNYDTAIGELAPPVKMVFRVKVPPETPTGTPISIATSASNWSHQAMEWRPGSEEATAEVLVPRGAWVLYKYARGDWGTVEKWPGCAEATNRYAFGAANPIKNDEVYAWADLCP